MPHGTVSFSGCVGCCVPVVLHCSVVWNPSLLEHLCRVVMAASIVAIPSTTSVLILADANFGDPKPHTVAEFLKFKPDEVFVQRITSLASLQAFGDSGVVSQENLKYLIVACLGPLIAGAATSEGDRKDSVGKPLLTFKLKCNISYYTCFRALLRPFLAFRV